MYCRVKDEWNRGLPARCPIHVSRRCPQNKATMANRAGPSFRRFRFRFGLDGGACHGLSNALRMPRRCKRPVEFAARRETPCNHAGQPLQRALVVLPRAVLAPHIGFGIVAPHVDAGLMTPAKQVARHRRALFRCPCQHFHGLCGASPRRNCSYANALPATQMHWGGLGGCIARPLLFRLLCRGQLVDRQCIPARRGCAQPFHAKHRITLRRNRQQKITGQR